MKHPTPDESALTWWHLILMCGLAIVYLSKAVFVAPVKFVRAVCILKFKNKEYDNE